MSAVKVGNDHESRFDIGSQSLNPLNVPGMSLSEADKEFIKSGALPREQLMRFLADVYYEPAWRRASDTDVDYFDGYQLTQEQLELFAARGLPPLIINLIQPVINSVLGLEAKTRSDWEVTFEDDASEMVAQALNKKMNDAERGSYADRACSEAYGGQVKAGLGWVEVTDQSNPFLYKYRVQSIHRREIWWDWRDQDMCLDNARYLVRKKWFDDDMITTLLPTLAPFLGGRATPLESALTVMDHLGETTGLDMSLDVERATTMDMSEWRDTERKRSIVYEIWYRVWQKGFVVRLPNDQVVEVDPDNYLQMQAIAAGVVTPTPAFWPKMRQSFWVGPNRIYDQWSPLPHQNFPYVPFWGFREDLSSMPYGLIRAMRCPQDEINARRSKMMTLMSARRAEVDADAIALQFNSMQDVANQVSGHNSFVILNPNRANRPNGFKVETNMDLSAAQLGVLQESKQEIHQVSGIFTAQQGEGKSGQSGRALDTLVEQGNTTLAEINDNYRFGRRKVGELLFSHVKRDSLQQHDVTIGEGKGRKTITLNAKAPGPSGQEEMLNDVAMSTAKVILQDVPSTTGYRQQQFMLLSEMTKALPPEVQAFIIDFVIEASDIPERKKVASRLRQALNMPEPGMEDQQPPPLPPEVQNEMAQGRQMVQDQQTMIQELSTKLQAALNKLDTGEAQHGYRMEELEREAELERAKHGGALQLQQAKTAGAVAAAAGESEGESTDKATEEKIMAKLDELGTKVEQIEQQVAQPRRSVVKDMGNGEYQVLSVPVRQEAPLQQPQG